MAAVLLTSCAGDTSGFVTIGDERYDLAWVDCASPKWGTEIVGHIETDTHHGSLTIETDENERVTGTPGDFVVRFESLDESEPGNRSFVPQVPSWAVEGDTEGDGSTALTADAAVNGWDDEPTNMRAEVDCSTRSNGGGSYSIEGQSIDVEYVRCEHDALVAYSDDWDRIDPTWGDIPGPAVEALAIKAYDRPTRFLLEAQHLAAGLTVSDDSAQELFEYDGERAVSTAEAERLGVTFDLECGIGPIPERE